MKYKILKDKSSYELDKQVNVWLEFGWILRGDLEIVTPSKVEFMGDPVSYVQAMTKEENQEDNND